MTESGTHLKGKVIVITGAASGFGKLVAEGAAARGARIVASDISADALATTVDGIVAGGGTAIACVADVTDLGQMRELARVAVESYGAIDVMLNNAGVMPLAFFEDHEVAAEAWDRCIDINFKGVVHGISAVYDQMIEQGRGHVVNVSSIYGNQPVVGGAVYGATKAAVRFMSEALRQETQGRIKVTTIRPTGVPATGLGAGIVNPQAVVGILGRNLEQSRARADGAGVEPDRERIGYSSLAPEDLAEQILYAIDQPWGVSISDVTVRASGDLFVI
jgi:NADP-dependent 3-hydroxy acid dehydrogenase YdfG